MIMAKSKDQGMRTTRGLGLDKRCGYEAEFRLPDVYRLEGGGVASSGSMGGKVRYLKVPCAWAFELS